jgi:hypothetical protein
MELQEQWRRVFFTRHRHWRHVGSHAAARTNRETGHLEQLPPFFLSSPAVTCKRGKTKKNATSNDLFSVFFFRYVSLHIFLFRLLLLCFRSLAVRRSCCRMGFYRVFVAAAGWRDMKRGNADHGG